ncbi:hypothetical protein [Pelagibius marinus]|uniref:hypothetical protein n=1 Tax=Pelagibius marinus TaxID=2762760 RepID=UPI0018723420|nr:hypothetical protein [Pelagibius marinus]
MDLIPLAAVQAAVDDLLGEVGATEIERNPFNEVGTARVRPGGESRLFGGEVK